MRETVFTDRAPKPIGPYSQAVKANGFLFVSGQVAFDPRTGKFLGGDVRSQTEHVLENLRRILEASGVGLERVVKATLFLKDMDDFVAVNEIYGRYFPAAPPARSTVAVSRLPKDALVEIEAVAAL
jgi:2-iminobutanoate/2-iminopropanoate deaminase